MFQQLTRKVWRKARFLMGPGPEAAFALRPPLPLPAGVSEAELRAFVQSVRPANAPAEEMARYGEQDFRRFVHTFGLVRDLSGPCLELGANPYFTTMLLRRFGKLDLTLANFCTDDTPTSSTQRVFCDDPLAGPMGMELPFHHFNVETDRFPFGDAMFNVVLFCEILEHLQRDPLAALLEIKRVLKPGGVLILTTPNVGRLENIARLLAGENIYDPYSAYGPYARHNREFTWRELEVLLDHAGFRIETMFSADVHENHAGRFVSITKLAELLPKDARDVGQYLFVRARNDGAARVGRPEWLYRGVAV